MKPERFSLVRAIDGLPAQWPTTVELRCLPQAVHVRFECRDDRAWATHTRRDAPLWQEEVVEVFLAPGLDEPKAYAEIEVNPLGALFDAWVSNPDGDRSTMSVDTSWDWPGIEWRAGRLGPRQDWWAELTLPWRGLGLESPPISWRANFYRIERPDGVPGPADEYQAWSPTFADPPDFHCPTRFGRIALPHALDLHPLAGREGA